MKRKAFTMPKAESPANRRLLDVYQRIDLNIREEFFRTLGINVIWVDEYKEIPKILTGLLKNEREERL